MSTQELTTARLSDEQIEAVYGPEQFVVPSTEQLLLYHGPELFTNVVSFSPVAHLVVAVDGRILRVNDVFREETGTDSETIAGLPLASLIAPESRARTAEMFDLLRLRKRTTAEWSAAFLVRGRGQVAFSLNAVVVSVKGSPRYITILARKQTRAADAVTVGPSDDGVFQSLVEHIPAITYVAEDLGLLNVRYISPQVSSMFGYNQGEWIDRPGIWFDVLHPDDRDLVQSEIDRGRDEQSGFSLEHRMITRDGREIWVRNEAALVPRAPGTRTCWHGVITDITAWKLREEAMARREARFRALLQSAPGGLLLVDRAGIVRYASPSFVAWTGADKNSIEPGLDAFNLVQAEDVPRFRQFLAEAAGVTGISPEIEVRLRTADGWRTVELVATNLLDDTDVEGIALNLRDVTDRREFENLLAHQAFHDPLTDLANRALFIDRLTHALERAQRLDQMIGLLYVDVDNFKVINDNLGHDNGDQLLIEIASRLLDAVRTVDTVARLGGDEFTVLIEDLTDLGAAIQCADRISKSLAEPFHLPGNEVEISASIGIAHSGTRMISPDDLLRAADIALYRAKNLGKARYAVFERGMTAPIHERLALEHDLRNAIERNELQVHFQPIVDLTNGFVRGVEALVRWQHPDRGLLMPEEFVAISESSGVIVDLGRHVLEQSCRQVREWQQRDQVVPPLALNVNLSTYQFRHPDIVGDIAHTLSESGLNPEYLTLEITESLILGNSGQTIDVLNDLKDLGVQLYIDDFGTGYSSLSFLKRFPVDGLKIDRTFVSGIERDTPNQRLVNAIIAAGQALDLDVVAEGIESIGQLSVLRNLACTDGQGHLFASPGPAEEIAPLVRSRVLLPQVRVLRDQSRRPTSQID